MPTLRNLLAPAKLNLFLHVTGRRADGYHLLESVFMRIDWCDTLHLTVRADGQISRQDLCNQSGALLGDEDLCVRAAKALQQALGTPLGAHIELEKRIPAQAGMGGGSSDAATVLLGLTELWLANDPQRQQQVRAQVLPQLAVALGADVPFFLLGQHALATGIGEQLQAMALPESRFLVVKPHAGVSTPAIFTHPSLKRDEPSVLVTDKKLTAGAFPKSEKLSIIEGFAADPYGFGHNSLQPVAELLCPEISYALAWLESKGLSGRMTGSGSAVFAHLERNALDPDLSDLPDRFAARICSNRVGSLI